MAVQFTYVPIATQTTSGSVSSVSFSSIPSTYQDLVLVANAIGSTALDLYATFNSDTGSNYSRTYIYGNGSSAGSGRDTSTAYIGIASINTTPSPNIIQIMNYANTSTYKTTLSRVNTSGATDATVGLWRSTAAINAITLTTSSGTIAANSSFTLYGLAAA
jgi:hypothetical protein